MGGLGNEQPSMHAPDGGMVEDPATISQPQMDGSVVGQDHDGQEIPTTNVSQPDIAPAAAADNDVGEPAGEAPAPGDQEAEAPAQPAAEAQP